MDLESWNKWVEYSKAKDEMFRYTDTKHLALVRGQRRRQEAARG